jgi:hypothetical protein
MLLDYVTIFIFEFRICLKNILCVFYFFVPKIRSNGLKFTAVIFCDAYFIDRVVSPNLLLFIAWTPSIPNETKLVSGGRAIAQAVSRGDPGSSPGQVMWDLWWTKWRWGGFSPSTLVSPANSHSTDCSTLIIIYHLGLVQKANWWPTYQVDSVTPHHKKLKTKLASYRSWHRCLSFDDKLLRCEANGICITFLID